MPKLTIKTDGESSINTKIFVDGVSVGLIQEFKLYVNANTGSVEMNAILPDLYEYKLSQNSALLKVAKSKKILESCGVKCELIKPPELKASPLSKEEVLEIDDHIKNILALKIGQI